MSTAAEAVLEQAHELVARARLLPVDEAAKALERSVTVLQAAQAELLATSERSGELKDSGCATVRSFAATILRRSPEDASQMARLALQLVHLPRLARAYREGHAHTANVRAVLSHLTSCGLGVLQAYEDALVELSTQTSPREIHHFCRELASVHRPDREGSRVAVQGGRLVRVRRVGDLAHLDAMLDPVVADRLKASLSSLVATASRRDGHHSPGGSAAAASGSGSEAASEPVSLAGSDATAGSVVTGRPRPYAERCADALEHILAAGMDRVDAGGDRCGSGRRIHATVTVQLETLLGLPDHGRAILHRFGAIPTATAARLSCDAVARLVVAHGGRVLDVGRTTRVVTRRQHAALAATYETCVMPGCAVRFADCDVHHLWWWSLGGPTDLDLQVPLCGSHHRWLHEGGCSITREEGRLVFRDPRDRVIANVADVLARQLSLVQQRSRDPASVLRRSATDALVERVSGDRGTRYRRGRWGATGHEPSASPAYASPGHASPGHASPAHASPARASPGRASPAGRTPPVPA